MKIKANKRPIRPKKIQNKEKQNKSPQKYLWICFLLVSCSLPGACLECGWYTDDHPGRKPVFPLPVGIDCKQPWLWCAICTPLPPPAPSVHFSLSVLKYHLHVLCMLSQSRGVHIEQSPVVSERHCFFVAIDPLWLLIFLPPLLHISWARRGGVWWRHPTECSQVSHPLHLAHLWLFVLIPIYCRKRLLWWGLSEELTYKDSKCHLESFCCCFFSRIMLVDFSLSSFRFLATSASSGVSSIS